MGLSTPTTERVLRVAMHELGLGLLVYIKEEIQPLLQ